jgi:hypothetical protein
MNSATNTKMISLVPTNGTTFTLSGGQKIVYEIPANIALMKGRDSYMVWDIENTSADNNRLMVNSQAGCEAVISRVDIYALRDGTHIETLNHYNQIAAMANEYLYEDKTNLQSLQGCGKKVYAHDQSATAPSGVTPTLGSAHNPEDAQLSPVNSTDGTQAYNFRRFTAPLKSGFLGRWWDDERLCPILATGGVRVEITLEDPQVALQVLNNNTLNHAGGAANITPEAAIGEGSVCANTLGFGAVVKVTGTTVADCGFAVGNKVLIDGDVGAGVVNVQASAAITAITQNANDVDIQTGGGGFAAATTVSVRLASAVKSANVRPSWRVVSVAPPADMINSISGGLQYEFTSYNYHTSSLLSSATQHQVELNSVATRAQCIMSSFVNTANTTKAGFSSYFAGGVPSELNLNSVQYFLKNRLQPVRAYDPNTTGQRVIAQHELAKSFDSISYEAVDLGNTDGANLDVYTNNFMIGRQLAKRPYYYDLKEAEGQIRLGFSGIRADNFTINTFVWNKFVLNVGAGADIAVVL